MQKKLTIEEFREYKEKLLLLLNKINQNEDYDDYYDEYFDIQTELLENDLSDIPFNEWKGIRLFSDFSNEVDFSKTNANLDFNLISLAKIYYNDEDSRPNLVLYDCNLKNINKLYSLYFVAFDDETKKNKDIFLSDRFDKEKYKFFKDNYYDKSLRLKDIANLEKDELKEVLSKKYIMDHLHYSKEENTYLFIKILGIKKAVEYYKENSDEADIVIRTIKQLNPNKFKKTIGEKLKKCKISEIKDIVFNYAKEEILLDRNILLGEMPNAFKQENPSLYLKDDKLPEYIKNRYLNRCLQYEDIIKYSNIFLRDNIENFINYKTLETDILKNIAGIARWSNDNLTNVLKEYLFFFKSLCKDKKEADYRSIITDYFDEAYNEKNKNIIDIHSIIKRSVKEYYEKVFLDKNKEVIPDWLLKFDFKIIKTIKTDKDLQEIDDNTIIINNDQRHVIEMLGLDNIKRLNSETKIFTHKFGENDLFTYLNKYIKYLDNNCFNYEIDKPYYRFNDYKILDYDDFVEALASYIALMTYKGRFKELEDKNYYINKLRKKYKDCFISEDAPSKLKDAYYTGRISNQLILDHESWTEYLDNIKVAKKLSTKKNICIRYGENDYHQERIVDILIEKFGNEYTFELIKKYDSFFNWIENKEFNIEAFDNKESINKFIRKVLYDKICSVNSCYYADLRFDEDMVKEYPQIFINPNSYFWNEFYSKELSYNMVRNNPALKKDLRGKKLDIAFQRKYGYVKSINAGNDNSIGYKETELITLLGKSKFLNFIGTWGSYANDSVGLLLKNYIESDNNPTGKGFSKYLKSFTKDELISKLEDLIIKECRYGRIKCSNNDAPSIIKERCPELFLDDNENSVLADTFYNNRNSYVEMSFKTLSERPNWVKKLKNKSIATAILREVYHEYNQGMYKFYQEYFDTFGFENGVKLGIKKPDDIKFLIEDNKTKLMKEWYDKTGKKFIPDRAVIDKFPIKDAEKFLKNTSRWINLKKVDEDGYYEDTLIKMAYVFGAFEKDDNGYNILMDELADIPKVIKGKNIMELEKMAIRIQNNPENHNLIESSLVNERFPLKKGENLLYQIYKKNYKLLINKKEYPKSTEALKELFKHYITNIKWINLSEKNIDLLLSIPKKISGDNCQVIKAMEDDHYFGIKCDEKSRLIETLIKEGFPLDTSKPIIEQLFEKSYVSTINRQSYPDTVDTLRYVIDQYMGIILTIPEAEDLFKDFTMKYDKYFKNFLFKNLDTIKEKYYKNNYNDYPEILGNIQSQFQEIKITNSNRKLTLELAESYVKNNNYSNVDTGNEELSKLASIIDYNQEDFEVLQDIYNYGKLRTFSSIPKIEGTMDKRQTTYKYEIIGLNDPMALAIGELSDCCQRLNDAAELDAEHSMIDPNGRIFIVRDDKNNIVAQSWVWRNKDVLCFDNIEIPHKASDRFEELYPQYDSEEALAMDIFEVYQKAAKEILEKDNKNYKKLLDDGKITKEQYEGLRLGVVTVGLGYNEIESAIINNAIAQEDAIKPLKSDLPIELNHNLWLDSDEQFSLAKRHDRTTYDGDTLPIYPDEYKVLNDKTMNEVSLLTLKKLELETKGYDSDEITSVNKKIKIVTELAKNYEIDPSKTKVIMNPNFGIIYEENDDEIVIADLVYNLEVNLNGYETDVEDKVLMQICLALKQIKNNKKFNTDMLNDYQKDMFNKALKIIKKIDIERGLSYVKQ